CLDLGPLIAALAGFFAFLGHLLPVFFQFRGGKGVATAFGLLFALHWLAGIGTGLAWLLVFGITRISSLASMISFVLMPLFIWLWLPETLPAMALLSAVLLGRHHSNIRKLLAGEQLGLRKRTPHTDKENNAGRRPAAARTGTSTPTSAGRVRRGASGHARLLANRFAV